MTERRENLEVLHRRARSLFTKRQYSECYSTLQKISEKCGHGSFTVEHNIRVLRLLSSRADPSSTMEDTVVWRMSVSEQVQALHPVALSVSAAYNHALFLAEQTRFTEGLVTILPFVDKEINAWMRDNDRLVDVELLLLALDLAMESRNCFAAQKILAVMRALPSEQYLEREDSSTSCPLNTLEALHLGILQCIMMAKNSAAVVSQYQRMVSGIIESSLYFRDALLLYNVQMLLEAEQFRDALAMLLVYLEKNKNRILADFWLRPMYTNNCGCLYAMLGKPNIALHYFSIASKEGVGLVKELQTVMLVDNMAQISYNLGMSLLMEVREESNIGICMKMALSPKSYVVHHMTDIIRAFHCFRFASQKYGSFPYVWLRMAECCTLLYMSKLESWMENSKNSFFLPFRLVESNQLGVRVRSIPLCLPEDETYCTSVENSSAKDGSEDSNDEIDNLIPGTKKSRRVDGQEAAGDDSMVSLASARSYLQNALQTLNAVDPATHLREVILTKIAYVSLCLSDYEAALQYSLSVLESSDVHPYSRYLVSMYAAECLVHLDRSDEALEYLSPTLLKDVLEIARKKINEKKGEYEEEYLESGQRPSSLQEKESFESKLSFFSARTTLYSNIAASFIVQGKLSQAREANSQAFRYGGRLPAAMMNQIYIEVAEKNTLEALKLFRRFRVGM